MNTPRVIPARLRGQKLSEATAELLLVEPAEDQTSWSLIRPGKRLPPGTRIALADRHGRSTPLTAEVLENDAGHARVRFDGTEDLLNALDSLGEMPLLLTSDAKPLANPRTTPSVSNCLPIPLAPSPPPPPGFISPNRCWTNHRWALKPTPSPCTSGSAPLPR